MPEQITKDSHITVSIVFIIGTVITILNIIGGILASYFFFVIRTLNNKIIELKAHIKDKFREEEKKIDDMKESLKNQRGMHEDHYVNDHLIELDMREVKTNLNNLIKDHERKYK